MAGPVQTMDLQTKPQYLGILATRAPLQISFQQWLESCSYFLKAGIEKAMEDMSGTHRLVSTLLQSFWPEGHCRISTSWELQLRSSPGPDQGQAAL